MYDAHFIINFNKKQLQNQMSPLFQLGMIKCNLDSRIMGLTDPTHSNFGDSVML